MSQSDNVVSEQKSSLSQENALSILEELKQAVETKDRKAISTVCSFLKSETNGMQISETVDAACESVMEYKTCKSNTIHYTTPESYTVDLSTIFTFLDDTNSCSHSYIYVDDDFKGFSGREVDYITNLGITHVDIINVISNEKIYSGLVKEDIGKKYTKDEKDGWMILIGVIIFISMGLLMKSTIKV